MEQMAKTMKNKSKSKLKKNKKKKKHIPQPAGNSESAVRGSGTV